ncbi:MAG: septum site-determining protein MinC [Burkholderiaceae bacterium]
MTSSPIELKFAKVDCLAVVVRAAEPGALLAQLTRKVGKAPGAYAGEPAILDCSEWNAAEPPPLGALMKALTSAGANLVGARGLAGAWHGEAEALGLQILSSPEAKVAETVSLPTTETAAPATEAEHPARVLPPITSGTLVIDTAVRSGQKIYAQGGDVIVLGQVSPGAEVIADGHIHVYGPLRGRALAGADGNRAARIVATSFSPELVAVAGFYMTFEQGHPPGTVQQPTQVFLDADCESSTLRIEPINIR